MIKGILDRSGVIARGIFEDFKQLLSPPLCIGCDGDLADNDPVFCESCLESLKSKCRGVRPICPFCGRLDSTRKNNGCCSRSSAIRLYYWGRYEDEMVEYILKFKFHGVLELGIRLTNEALNQLGELLRKNDYDYVIPVPLHGRRQRRREYNQSEIIARTVSRTIGAEYIPDSIFRVRSTKQQAKIHYENERWENVENAFSLLSKKGVDFVGRRVLIVDDIVTTGATVYEVSRPIREQNPDRVDVFSLAYAG
ncbi:MAG: ComF family protein [Candidatus Zixiibacteriota bacterium]|nr:MAG: ComF family protein [candidate division Zixibacteria bacterium]